MILLFDAQEFLVTSSLVLYHGPQTRSTGVRILLEELQAPHDLKLLNLRAGEHRRPEFLAINPMGKVPTLVHNGAVITEQVAIYLYLGDLFAHKGLAPSLQDPSRGPYLRWLAFYGSCFEPAIMDKSLGREPGRRAMMPYGNFEVMFDTLVQHLAQGPYMIGEHFTAADVLWGTALEWMLMFNMVPETSVVQDYVQHIVTRPAFQAIKADDAKLVAEFDSSGA